jgi:hypothetical protein
MFDRYAFGIVAALQAAIIFASVSVASPASASAQRTETGPGSSALTSQTITFPAIAPQLAGATLALKATASSGLAVSFASKTTSVCTVSGTTATVLEAGTCEIEATQAGNAVFAAAPAVRRSFAVMRAQQRITFPEIAAQVEGTTLALEATASSGLPVKFVARRTAGVCKVAGTTATMLRAGTCTIEALQQGDAIYAAALPVSQSFAVTSQPKVAIASFTASPAMITAGGSSTLAWSSTNATSCTASGGWSGAEATSGTQKVMPTATTSYSLTCAGTGGSASATAMVTVNPAPPPPAPTVSLSASPTTITSGGSSTLSWSSTNATSCTASGGWSGAEATSGTQKVTPTTTASYMLACTGAGGSANATATVTVNAAPAPTVTLSASPTTITSGGSSMLTWSSTNATSCTASGGWSGNEAASGMQQVTPTATTSYTLTCTGTGGSANATAAVTVNPAPPAPTVTLTASPTTITAGGSSTLSWSSANATTCMASGGWSGSEAIPNGTQQVMPTATTSYTLTCTGAGGSAAATTSVTVSAGTGPSLVFSYPNGFASAGAHSAINTVSDATQFNGSVIALTTGQVGVHEGGAAWYKTQQNIQSFITDFTFQLAAAGPGQSIQGITFCIQNTTSADAPNFGIFASADANGLGYAAYAGLAANQIPILNSVAVKFDLSGFGQASYPTGGSANGTGLYINGGPSIFNAGGLIPENDLNPSGVNLHSGDVMAAHIVYDGSLLTMTLLDTVTNAQFRYSWPVNIPAAIGSNTAWVGFTAGEIPAVVNNLLTWDFFEGYNPRLAAPTASVAAGSYTAAQSVSLGAPAGSTIYYTVNGQQPTTSSSRYTGPITVSSSEVVQAIAVETGFTDSLVAASNYQIAPAGSPLIDFPGGFANASNLVAVDGSAQFNASNLQLTDLGNTQEVGAAWYAVPVNVQSFATNFTIQFQPNPNSQQVANGMTFTIQNQNPTATDSGDLYVSGGPNAIGNYATGLGYAGLLNSVAVIFDIDDGGGIETGDLTGLYTNGANPTGSSIDMSASGLKLMSGRPLAVALTYNGTTLAMTIEDTVTHATFSNSWAIDIPTTVGGDTAYVGFTASTGFQIAGQKVLSWTYENNE